MASSPSPACRQCNDLLRHLHAKNLEIAGLKEQLAQLAHFRQQRHASFTLRAKSKSVEPDATSLSEIITPSPTARDTIVERLQRERDDLAKTNDTLKSEVARLRDELAKNAATPRTAPSTCGGRQEVNASPASNYATRDDGASRPESHAPSAMQTPRAVSNRASLSGTPMSNRTSRSEGRSPRREATNPAVHQRASESRRELNQISGEVLRSASRSPQLQRAAAQLCEEFEHSAVLRTEQRFARRVRQNPAVLAERIASLSPGRANVSQPQRAVASISGWRSLRLPIGERPPVVTSPRDLPPSPPRERGIGESPDTLFGERYLRVASGSSRLDEWDEAKVREAESALRTLRTAVMRVDRVAYMSMHQVEYSRDPCGPFKASFAAIKQIVATHARADKTDTARTVADGQTWPVTPTQLSMIPAAMAASLSKYLRACLCSFDYMTETAHSAQQSILPTLREFFANIDTLSQIAAQPLVAAHL